MKIIIALLSLLHFVSCAGAPETKYTASTPAAAVIRTFLGIAQADSIDFIRWKLTLMDSQYVLQCNYGIGKNNTNGFMDGGKNISISGRYSKNGNYFQLQQGDHILNLVELNANLLHLLDENNRMLVGNGGWSFTINNIASKVTNDFKLIPVNG